VAGKGAAIGALIGGAGGAGAQVFTGRSKDIPAETELKFKWHRIADASGEQSFQPGSTSLEQS